MLNKYSKYSFEVLFVENYKLLYKVINFITQNKDDTSDILHDTYLKAVSKFDPKRSKPEALKWLTIIARNTALSFVKQNKSYDLIENHENIPGSSELSLSVFFLYNLDALENIVPSELFDYLLENIIEGIPLLELSKRSGITYEKLRYWRKILLKELEFWIKDNEREKYL